LLFILIYLKLISYYKIGYSNALRHYIPLELFLNECIDVIFIKISHRKNLSDLLPNVTPPRCRLSQDINLVINLETTAMEYFSPVFPRYLILNVDAGGL